MKPLGLGGVEVRKVSDDMQVAGTAKRGAKWMEGATGGLCQPLMEYWRVRMSHSLLIPAQTMERQSWKGPGQLPQLNSCWS